MSKFAILSLAAGLGLFLTACAGPKGNQDPASSIQEPLAQVETIEAPETSEALEAKDSESLEVIEESPSTAAIDAALEGAVVSSEGVAPTLPEPTSQDFLESGKALIQEGKLVEAREAFTKALHAWDLKASAEQEVITALNDLNRQLFLSTEVEGDMQKHIVVRGDSLLRVAKQYNTTWQFISRLNGLENTTIFIGKELTVPKNAFALIVKKDRFVMDLVANGAFIKRYTIGTGVANATPVGEFTVSERIESPKDNGTKPGKLGSHWLGLKGVDGYEGYGLHGLPEAEYDRLGGEWTQGSVCLTNADIQELYDLLPSGSKVTIKS